MFGRPRKDAQPATAPAGGLEAPVEPAVARPEVTLGALRSEFDQNRSVAPACATVADITEQVVDVYRHGRLDALTTLQALRALHLTDQSGAQWSLGATTRRWYRRLPGGVWRIAVPPALDDLALTASAAAAAAAVQQVLGVEVPDDALEDLEDLTLESAPRSAEPAPTGPNPDAAGPIAASGPVSGSGPADATTGGHPTAEDDDTDPETAALLAAFMGADPVVDEEGYGD